MDHGVGGSRKLMMCGLEGIMGVLRMLWPYYGRQIEFCASSL